jgi:hypothetical protein
LRRDRSLVFDGVRGRSYFENIQKTLTAAGMITASGSSGSSPASVFIRFTSAASGA